MIKSEMSKKGITAAIIFIVFSFLLILVFGVLGKFFTNIGLFGGKSSKSLIKNAGLAVLSTEVIEISAKSSRLILGIKNLGEEPIDPSCVKLKLDNRTITTENVVLNDMNNNGMADEGEIISLEAVGIVTPGYHEMEIDICGSLYKRSILIE